MIAETLLGHAAPSRLELHTLGAILRSSVAKDPKKVAMMMPGKDGFVNLTYQELLDNVRAYAGHLVASGVKRGDRVILVAENCPEWAWTDWACFCLGAVIVPLYPTLTQESVQYMVKDSGAKIAIFDSETQLGKLSGIEGVFALQLKGSENSLDSAARANPNAMSVAELHSEIDATNPEDLCSIIYTSGTTGQPKGAMMPHRAFCHVSHAVDKWEMLSSEEVFLSFLPMSHVYERVAGQILPIYLGATIAYSKNLMSLANDMTSAKPTVMLCVPRFLENLREKVLDGVRKAPPLRQRIFNFGLQQGVTRARGGFAPFYGLTDKLVGAKIRERTGGRLTYFVSGGAALAKDVAEFYMAMGLTVLQGYGLTESSGGSSLNHPQRNKYWTVGQPLDMDVSFGPDGEIWLKGLGLMLGYYNLPGETADCMTEDGWFKTGDIGEFEGQNLIITDRKKDILVLANGKNIAPQSIENKLKSSEYITEAVCFGDGKEYLGALIVPNLDALQKLAATKGVNVSNPADLLETDEVKKLIKSEVDKVNKTLANFELVKKHTLVATDFSVDSGELTPTLKVKRKVVKEKFAAQIDSMF